MLDVSPMLPGSVRLRDGRRLSYTAVGPATAFPVLYMHGAIGSPRCLTPALVAALGSLGIRYIVVERPGFGGSDPNPGRTVAGFPDDVEQLADGLGLGRFAAVGVSAGAPYALACAWAMPDRVRAGAVSALPAPGDGRAGWARLRYLTPWLPFGAPVVGPALAAAMLCALRLRGTSPPRAMLEDYAVCSRPWGFDPAEVGGPVRLWHARHDRLVPAAHALRLADALPACVPELVPRGGHFFFRSRTREILESVVGADRDANRLAA